MSAKYHSLCNSFLTKLSPTLFFFLPLFFIIDPINSFGTCPYPVGAQNCASPVCGTTCYWDECKPTNQTTCGGACRIDKLPVTLSDINDVSCANPVYQAVKIPFILPGGRTISHLPDIFDDQYRFCEHHSVQGPPCCTQTGTGPGGNTGYWYQGPCVSSNTTNCAASGSKVVACVLSNYGTGTGQQCTTPTGSPAPCPVPCCNTAQPTSQCNISSSGNWTRIPIVCAPAPALCGGDNRGNQHYFPQCSFECCFSGSYPTLIEYGGCTIDPHQQYTWEQETSAYTYYNTQSWGDWWAYNDWGPCVPNNPGACGANQGTQTRTVSCQPNWSGCTCTTNLDQCCDQSKRPPSTRSCDVYPGQWSLITDSRIVPTECTPCGVSTGNETKSPLCLTAANAVTANQCCDPASPTRPPDQNSSCIRCCSPADQFATRAFDVSSTTPATRTVGATAQLSCRAPNTGSSTVTCSETGVATGTYSWLGPEPSCACGDPNLQLPPSYPATVSPNSTGASRYDLGRTATLNCNSPLVGLNTVVTCGPNSNGSSSWQGNPTCNCASQATPLRCVYYNPDGTLYPGTEFYPHCDNNLVWPSTAFGASPATLTVSCLSPSQTHWGGYPCYGPSQSLQRSCTATGWGPVPVETPCHCGNPPPF